VTEQCNELTSRGQQPYDILHLLFEAYRTASNDEFQEYIRAKQSAVYHDLTSVAEEKYKIMMIKGEWKGTKGTTTSTEDHIIALQAQMIALQAASQATQTTTFKKPATKGKGTKDDRLGHLPFKRIRQLAIQGDLPVKLSRCDTPKCAACMYGKATRRAWRTRTPTKYIDDTTSNSAGCSSVSGSNGISGAWFDRPNERVPYPSTIQCGYHLINHFSGLSYVYIQKGSTVEETVEGKRAFEQYSKNHGIMVKHYHADNGIFEAQGFQDAKRK
jgi:hypothetical protein